MSLRDIETAAADALSGTKHRIFHLIDLLLEDPEYLSTAHRALTFGGNAYLAAADLIDLGEIEESTEIRSNIVDISFSAVSQARIFQGLTEPFTDRRVIVRRCLLDDEDDIIDDPFVIFDGRIDSWSIAEDPDQGISTITWQVASHWVDFERTNGRRSNHEDQQIHFPGDRGLEFAADTAEVTWGSSA